jgi:hypothetical protein
MRSKAMKRTIRSTLVVFVVLAALFVFPSRPAPIQAFDHPLAGKVIGLDIDTGQSATTNRGGKYSTSDIPAGQHTATASIAGYTTETKPVTVVADQTTVVDFALVPE